MQFSRFVQIRGIKRKYVKGFALVRSVPKQLKAWPEKKGKHWGSGHGKRSSRKWGLFYPPQNTKTNCLLPKVEQIGAWFPTVYQIILISVKPEFTAGKHWDSHWLRIMSCGLCKLNGNANSCRHTVNLGVDKSILWKCSYTQGIRNEGTSYILWILHVQLFRTQAPSSKLISP